MYVYRYTKKCIHIHTYRGMHNVLSRSEGYQMYQGIREQHQPELPSCESQNFKVAEWSQIPREKKIGHFEFS